MVKILKDSLEIIFVQLGNSRYKHLFPNIELIHRAFPQISINCIISDESPLIKRMPPYVSVFIYKPDVEIDDLFKRKTIDPNFRNGFWRYTLDRLIAIEAFHANNKNRSYLHVESDILLLPQFPFQKFLEVKKICWLPHNPVADSAGLVFFPKYELTRGFKNDLINYITRFENPTDMKALSYLRHKFPDKYKTLPVCHVSLPKLNRVKIKTPLDGEIDFGGIFDALNIGMWLTGIDPKNSYGFLELFASKKIIVDNSFIDPSAYAIQFSEKKGLYFKNGDHEINIYNLHIHSKSLRIFSRSWGKEIKYLTMLSNKNEVRTRFYPNILFYLILENLLKGTFHSFLYNSPIFSFMRRFNKFLKSLWIK